MSKHYPNTPDDELRELLYGARDSDLIPRYYSISRAGHSITVGKELDGTVATTVNDVFKCSWPKIMRNYLLLDLPMAVQENAGSFSIAYRRAQHNKDLYHFYPEQLETEGMPNWDLDSSLRQFRVALCATLDAEDAVRKHCGAEQTTTEDCTPALAWTLAYDTLMLNVWHNELQEKGVSISFRPRWSAFPTTAELANLEFPLIIPDVVFSIRIHVSHPT
ncbi:hypothetical protein CPB85DRAFT_874354 [Mucidula mucida]|nr:hypothetical protein CPB85DRAFT_874354 [Mucidula mucida]